MKYYYSIILMGILSWILGCKNVGENDNSIADSSKIVLNEIVHKKDTTEGDFHDVSLSIISDTFTDTSHTYIGKGLYDGNVVGLKVEVKNGMPAGLIDAKEPINKAAFVHDGVIISSIGMESDEFIKALSTLYYIKPTSLSFTKEVIKTTSFSLNKVDVDLSKKGFYKFKLFFEENSDENYAELFLNLDLVNRVIELAEKDIEYRKNIIKVMTK